MSTQVDTFGRPAIPTPVTGWRRLFGDWLLVGSATTVCHALGAVTALLLRMFLSPAQMGVWQALKLFLSYGNYANLGISKGAAREFNVALGHGHTDSARHGLNLAFAVNTISSLVYATVLLTVAAWIALDTGGRQGTTWAIGLAVVAALAVLSRYVTFHVTILRNAQAFAATSQLSLLEAVATLAIAAPATWLWGLPGLYGGTLGVLLVSLVFVRRHRVADLHFAWEWPEIRRLVGIGGPILLAGALSSLLRSLDKLMLLSYLGDGAYQLGCYSAALLVSTQLFGLGNMLSMVAAPRYGEIFGRTGSRRQTAQLAAQTTDLHAAAIVLPAGWAMVVAGPLLAWLLPDYRAGLPALPWLATGVVALVVAMPANRYLVAVDQQRRALFAVAVATGAATLGNHVALQRGLGLEGVAAATAGAYALFFVVQVAASLWPVLGWPSRLRYLGMLALAVGPTLAVAWHFSLQDSPATVSPATVVGHAVIVTLVWVCCMAIGWQQGHWRAYMKRTEN